ncbi:co-chaperone YbbN [Psychrobacillus sp. OK032]|uniref:thioredoxin family protein n=1 Tax=Psychrobacillus sp. OK032 TaxID=1884358 RepID=UPI0008CCA01D|nr:thioredoxin family protein [Psychrobacillus sp. OK032]SER88173.1 thioredoxin 1 [Psychrobacillus sp. OK032]
MTKPIEITIRKLSKPGCRPCAVLSYAMADIGDQLTQANAVVSEHDITQEPELIAQYGITGVPVMIYERNGVEVARLSGMVSAEEILEAVEYAKEVR